MTFLEKIGIAPGHGLILFLAGIVLLILGIILTVRAVKSEWYVSISEFNQAVSYDLSRTPSNPHAEETRAAVARRMGVTAKPDAEKSAWTTSVVNISMDHSGLDDAPTEELLNL